MTSLMTSLLVSSAVVMAIVLPRPRLAYAGDRIIDCSAIADHVVEKSGGRLLSIRPHAQDCTVTVLVHEDGKRPHKLVVKVDSKDVPADSADAD